MNEIEITDAAKALLDEHGITDYTLVEGTGKDGKILKSDAEEYLDGLEGEATKEAVPFSLSPLDSLTKKVDEAILESGLASRPRSLWYLNDLKRACDERQQNGKASHNAHYAVIIKFKSLKPYPTEHNLWKDLHKLHTEYLELYNSEV